MKVLLADDDRVLTHLLSSGLRARGVETFVAHDAMQALMHAMQALMHAMQALMHAMRSPPDVIVLDIQMPGGTGIEALRKLTRSVRTSSIPVVVLSGSVEPEAAQAVKALGAVEFLLKPVDPEALYKVLCAVLHPQAQAG